MGVVLQARVHCGVAITEQNVGVRRRNTPLCDVDMTCIIWLRPVATTTRSNLPVRVGISDHRGFGIARLERAVTPPVTVKVRVRRVLPTPRCDAMGFHNQEEAVVTDTVAISAAAQHEGVRPFGFHVIVPWPARGKGQYQTSAATPLDMSTKA